MEELNKMAADIDQRGDWWRFPAEGDIKGFMGASALFFVGDQLSTSPWGPNNKSRRAFYDALLRVGAADAHLTDLFKRRGKSSALLGGLPNDFQEHVTFLRREISLLSPTRVIAVGQLSYDLLTAHVPEVRPILHKIYHFSYIARYNKVAEYEANIRAAMTA